MRYVRDIFQLFLELFGIRSETLENSGMTVDISNSPELPLDQSGTSNSLGLGKVILTCLYQLQPRILEFTENTPACKIQRDF